LTHIGVRYVNRATLARFRARCLHSTMDMYGTSARSKLNIRVA
jgi:hypothetical protein